MSWPVAYRNIYQQTGLIIQYVNYVLLLMSDIILFSSTHHGCLIAAQCSIFTSTTLKIVLLVVYRFLSVFKKSHHL